MAKSDNPIAQYLTQSELYKRVEDKESLVLAHLEGWCLRGVDFSGSDLQGARLLRADLTGADLRGANLVCANLIGACLKNARLEGADFRYASLWRADLSGTGACLVKDDIYQSGLGAEFLVEADRITGLGTIKPTKWWATLSKDSFYKTISPRIRVFEIWDRNRENVLRESRRLQINKL